MKTIGKIAVIVVVISLCVVAVICSRTPEPQPVDYTSYRVRRGDTLWSIAEMSNGYGYIDTRIIIHQMDADPEIYPNDIVMIPQYEVNK